MAPEQSTDSGAYRLLVAMVSRGPRFTSARRLAARKAAFYEQIRSQLEARLQRRVTLAVEDVTASGEQTAAPCDGAVIDLSRCTLAECLDLASRLARVTGPTVFVEDARVARSWHVAVITYDVDARDAASAGQIAGALVAGAGDTAARRSALARQLSQHHDDQVAGFLKRGAELTRSGDYAQAVAVLEALKPTAPNNALLFQELGIAYGKLDNIDAAEAALRRALEIEPQHAEVWANLGGILRRKALGANGQISRVTLQFARECYARSWELDPSRTYALTNLTRIDLLLSAGDSASQERVATDFQRLEALCREKLAATPGDYWLRYDLADALLFGVAPGDTPSAAQAEFDRALAETPAEQRPFVTKTVGTVVQELLRFGVGSQAQQQTLREWQMKLGLG